MWRLTSTPSVRRCQAMRGRVSSGSQGAPLRARTTHSRSLAGRFTTGAKPRWVALPARPLPAPQFPWARGRVSGGAVEGAQRLEATGGGGRLARALGRREGVAGRGGRAVRELIEVAGGGAEETRAGE